MLYDYFYFNDTPTTYIYTLSLHDALPIWPYKGEHEMITESPLPMSLGDHDMAMERGDLQDETRRTQFSSINTPTGRSEEHTSELQSLRHLVCRLLLEKKKKKKIKKK